MLGIAARCSLRLTRQGSAIFVPPASLSTASVPTASVPTASVPPASVRSPVSLFSDQCREIHDAVMLPTGKVKPGYIEMFRGHGSKTVSYGRNCWMVLYGGRGRDLQLTEGFVGSSPV